MIVDDEHYVEKIVEALLEKIGYEHVSFHDSEKAIEFFSDNSTSIDLAILDYEMPKITGTTLAASMHALKPDMPIVLMTGQLETIQPEESTGIVKILRKPMTRTELAEAVKEYLEPPHEEDGT